ncbi:hypothetical protein [Streptomyces sp. MUM 2J]|uniref:hypothetical protein n=1 Tax=Streptomyces sp. MUM 2J TaxID=2791987 RepID=UPI001F046473|nr:hypothetical protein [Streptomyces sp. MUM 2J]MCH0561803.1 hypothetical protein [Streptomyces sp. MUM 2J]
MAPHNLTITPNTHSAGARWHGSKLSRTPADQHVPAPASSTTRPEPWNPAPTRRDSRAISLVTTSLNSRNGPPKNQRTVT